MRKYLFVLLYNPEAMTTDAERERAFAERLKKLLPQGAELLRVDDETALKHRIQGNEFDVLVFLCEDYSVSRGLSGYGQQILFNFCKGEERALEAISSSISRLVA